MSQLPTCVLILISSASIALGGGASDLSETLRPLRDQHKIPGLAAAVLHKGEIVAAGAVGVRKAGKDTPVTIEDKFHIGSCTKAMTATLCAILVEEGAIRLDSTIGEVLGDHFDIDDRWSDVQLGQLLNHRGGGPGDLPPAAFALRGQQTARARELLVQMVLRKPPGEVGRFVYSNAGYVVAAAMIEQVTAKTWEELIQTRLLRPLGIESAGFGAPGLPGSLDQPRGHNAEGLPLEPTPFADNPLALGPAGTLHMTLTDWLKFAGLHIRGRPAGSHVGDLLGLPPAVFKRMHTADEEDDENYASGWVIAKSRLAGINVLAHDGSNTLWYATIWVSPKLDLAVVVAANQGGPAAAAATHSAMEAILKHQLGADKPDASERPR